MKKGAAMKKGIVLVNGGIHSTTALAVAKSRAPVRSNIKYFGMSPK